MSTYIYVYLYICIYVRTNIYVYTYIFIYTYIHINKYTYIHIIRERKMVSRGEVGGWGQDPKKCTGRDWGMGSSTI